MSSVNPHKENEEFTATFENTIETKVIKIKTNVYIPLSGTVTCK